MARFCAQCGASLPPSARFCVSCGHQVDGAVPASASGISASASEIDQPTAPMTQAGPPAVAPPPAASSPSGAPPRAESPPLADTAPIRGGAQGQGDSAAPHVERPAGVFDQFAAWPDHPDARTGRSAAPYGGSGSGASALAATPSARGEDPDRLGRKPPTWPLLVAVAVLLVAGLIWAFMALRGGGGPSPSASTSAAASSGTVASSSPAPTTTLNAEAQAARVAVGQILDSGRGSRTTLMQGIEAYCTKGDKPGGKAQIDEALQGRMAQLAKVNDVGDGPFAKVKGGIDARDKLRAALQASAAADQVYVQMANAGTICQGGLELTQANAHASTTKKTFLDTWNPIMTAAKLQPLGYDEI
jgi:hypothetical protein